VDCAVEVGLWGRRNDDEPSVPNALVTRGDRTNLADDLILPTLLFAALGAMTWAIRGCSGFGGVDGCIFAGVTWGTAWWFVARQPTGAPPRRYSSGWIILALTLGIGISGNRGWMQWPSFFDGQLQTNAAEGRFVPISNLYGFVWLFIAGVPWAGLGACLLAWCGEPLKVPMSDWLLRASCGIGAAVLARILFNQFPQVFLPLYSTLQTQYADLHANPNLRRLMNDNRAAVTHLGFYLGFLASEVIRRDWKNVSLIATVGVANGVGWAACQNWRWAHRVWPDANFNWWRCWESSGGICVGLAYGLAFYFVNRPSCVEAKARYGSASTRPNFERLGVGLGLVLGLGLSIKNGMKGWANIYLGNEDYWNRIFWSIAGPAMALAALGLLIWVWLRPFPAGFSGDIFPNANRVFWLVLFTQNIIAQLVTGPLTSWNEMAFSLYYFLLFLLSAVITHHFAWRQKAFSQIFD